jgi:exonuclease SbcC
MAVDQIVAKLEHRYPDLQRVGDAIFRGVDLYEGRPYAIRYFDLSDDLPAAENLREYQDKLLGVSYFDSESKPDLRWNHYLYFISSTHRVDDAFRKAKAAVEGDREYARKIVVAESDLDTILDDQRFGAESSEGLPPDALSIWSDILEKHNLGFIVDESLQVPAIVRDIADGEQNPVLRAPSTPELDAAEKAASTKFLSSIEIRGFGKYPIQKSFTLGAVNLILGVNGVGKTSLLEAIEYLFCGKTCRARTVPPRTSVSGVLSDSNLTLQTKSSTTPATLRSRHLAWYGKSELRTLTLHDSFSKFNFLDTDAAVRLSVEKSRERITEDLAQLLLGAEAAKALDRFERVARQLEDSRKVIESNISIKDLRRTDSLARIQQLRDTPHQSDQLFSDLLLSLRSLGWIQEPTIKSQTDELSASIQAALVNVVLLKSAGDLRQMNPDELQTATQTLAESEQIIQDLSKEDGAREREHVQVKLQFQALTKRVEALEALAPMVTTGVGELYRTRESLERQIAERTSVLAEAEAAAASLPLDSALRGMMLARAVKEWTEQVLVADERTDNARRTLAAFERTQNILSSLQQRLRSSAQEIMQHSGDRTHCPLCRAEYSEAELKRRFDEVARGLVTAESDRLRSELRTAETLHQQRVSELRALEALEQFIQGGPARTSVAAAIRSVTSERERVATLVSELEAARSALQVQENKGWTFAHLIELLSALGIPESELTSGYIDSTRAAVQEEQKRFTEAIQKLEADAGNSRARIAQIGIAYNLPNASAAELGRVVSERKRTTEELRRAIVALGQQLDLARLNSAAELEAALRETHDLTVRLRTAVAQEQRASGAIAREQKLVDDAVAEIEGLRVKLRRVDNADTVIRDLLAQQSERSLTETVLHENAARIASTFAKIHAPNEFDLLANGGLRIVRRGGGDVELDEMSSGQRAAYALSLFLAMNERLKAGPRVLLFDDPVAHVDDINTLSLLDHLRDIALSGQRQIFFATADSKIGGLFGRKFRFLGERFRQIELARS